MALLNRRKVKREYIGGLRQSQILTTFGPGAISNISGCAVMVKGLDFWFNGEKEKNDNIIYEPNLQKLLHKKYFCQPPADESKYKDVDIPDYNLLSERFPRMYFCPKCHRLAKYYEFDNRIRKDLKCPKDKVNIIPMSFMVACVNGHIADFPYDKWVHQWEECKLGKSKELFFDFSGKTGGLEGYVIRCSCGVTKSFKGVMSPNSLKNFKCFGNRPWLKNDENNCAARLHVVFRGSANTYYAQTASALTIPHDNDLIHSKIDNFFIETCKPIYKLGESGKVALDALIQQKFSKELLSNRLTLEGIFKELCNIFNSTREENVTLFDIRKDEYVVLHRGTVTDEINYHYKAVETDVPDILKNIIDKVVLIPRLREVMALIGFRRIYPNYPESKENGSVEFSGWNGDEYVPISENINSWLPAVELLGEGIFIEFNKQAINDWTKMAYFRYKKIKSTPGYILLHTISHLIIRQLSIDCGYSNSSLKERIYYDLKSDMHGILIYTSSADSDGSLGGLVRMGKAENMSRIFMNMVYEASWCSADPVCIESYDQVSMGNNLAACHACTLIPEICCEDNNCYLDRAAIVGTIDKKEMGFLSDLIL